MLLPFIIDICRSSQYRKIKSYKFLVLKKNNRYEKRNRINVSFWNVYFSM